MEKTKKILHLMPIVILQKRNIYFWNEILVDWFGGIWIVSSLYLYFAHGNQQATLIYFLPFCSFLYYYIKLLIYTTKMAHSGYDRDRFINLTFGEFDCLICTEVVMDPIQCDGCGVLICKLCINDWIAKNPLSACPNRCGGKNFTPIKSKALVRAYQSLTLRCINPKCTSILKLGELKSHEALCLKVKCWNFAVCNNPENELFKFSKPCCSRLCNTVDLLKSNNGNHKKMYEILTQYLPLGPQKVQQQVSSISIGSSTISTSEQSQSLIWDNNNYGTGIVISDGNTSVFLKEQAYVFRTITASIGFTSGIHYWEIIADARTQNQIKIGVTSSKAFDMNSAFCDHPFGWAYYGLAQLRHGSNATGPSYGKRFKKEGVLGVCLNMNKGSLSFSLNGEFMGQAYVDEKLKIGPYYPAVSLLHCAGCKIRGVSTVPSCFL